MGTAPEWLDAAQDSPEHQYWCRRTLEAYFERHEEGPAFSGSRFESLGNNDPWRLTFDDVVAVSLLSVEVPPHATIRVLERDGDEITDLLEKIGPDQDLHTVGEEIISRGSAAWELWDLVRGIDRIPGTPRSRTVRIGQTTTSKLLARKRPRLLPVYDSVVAKVVGLAGSGKHWAFMHDLLREQSRVDVLQKVKADVDLPEDVSLLRVFDVLLWMSVRDGHRPPSVPSSATTTPSSEGRSSAR